MGDKQGQGGLDRGVYFLEENHCRNRHIIDAIKRGGFICERHLDHLGAGTPDREWSPVIAARNWPLITFDARIRTNLLEREAVRVHRVRMFYFSRNNLAGQEIGVALEHALPDMQHLVDTQRPPFTASISKRGDVQLRDTFKEWSTD